MSRRDQMHALAAAAHVAVIENVPLSKSTLRRLELAHHALQKTVTAAEAQLCLSVYTLTQYPLSDEALMCVSSALDLYEAVTVRAA